MWSTACRSPTKAGKSSTRFLRSLRANGRSPSSWATATRNSHPGRSGRRCDRRRSPRPGPMTTALLFDLDGTLVDSDAEHLVAFQRAFAPHGVALDRAEYVASIMGASNEMIGRKFLPHLPHDLREQTLAAKEAAYRDGLGDLQSIAGVAALLDWADAKGLSRAVVTNAPRANAELVLAAIGLAERLPIRIIASELERS